MKEYRNSLHGQKEIRTLDIPEIRIVQEDGTPKLRGYAAVFNKKSELLYGFFRETIAPGAFAEAILKDDVRGLQNHDPNYVLGRNKAGTMTLEEDKKGLAFVIAPPETQWARDLQVSINRGDINQCSFAFEVEEDEWNEDDTERLVKKVSRLYDISIVTYPAYPQTSAKMRCAMTEAGLDCKSLGDVLSRRGALTERDKILINNAIEALRVYLPKETPVPPGAPSEGCAAKLDILKRQLALIALG
jgi:HK97 family phage prohead protease